MIFVQKITTFAHQNFTQHNMNEIFIIIGLILLNGVFSMSEVALISARKSRLTLDVKKGNKSAQTALDLAGKPDKFLSTVQIGITLIGLLTGIYSGNRIADDFSNLLITWGMNAPMAHPVAQGVIVVIVTYLTIVFGELVPKRIGMGMSESVAKIMAQPMNLLAKIGTPFVWLLSFTTDLVLRIFGINGNDNKLTEEEIKSIIKEGAEEGAVEPVEQDIMQRVLLLGDMKVGSIMTHKSDIIWIDASLPTSKMNEIINQRLFAAYPVGNGDMDHIVGMIWLKDLVTNKPTTVGELAREATYFHEGMPVFKVLEQMKERHISRALICDEFGAFVGLVTLKDILEALVGNIDNNEKDPDIVERENNQGWLVDGQCAMHDLLCYFDRSDLFDEDANYHTIAGLVLDQKQSIPSAGDKIEWNGFTIEIMDMDGARIDKVLITQAPDEE